MSDEGGAESRLDATECKVSWDALMNAVNEKTARDPGQHDENDDATRGGIVEQRQKQGAAPRTLPAPAGPMIMAPNLLMLKILRCCMLFVLI